MISQSVEYALRAIVTIAQNEGEPCTAQKIAEITKVPGPYLSKLMQVLVRRGLVSSQRGLHGGFLLVRSPTELTIWDVVDAVEPIQRITTCPLEIKSHANGLCPLHRNLDQAMETVERMFRRTTMADMLSDSDSVTPLCEHQKTFTIDSSRVTKTKKSRTASGEGGKRKS
ncbi:MAG: Rrf2 family transcriptional regulator [Pirellulales bacterium]|nr:Rrf2 family transcriptional regulator [Pirellulales bacterium]